MVDVNYDINMVYASFGFIIYKYISSNYDILNLNYEWIGIIIINIIGLYLLLKNMTFEIKLSCSIGRK